MKESVTHFPRGIRGKGLSPAAAFERIATRKFTLPLLFLLAHLPLGLILYRSSWLAWLHPLAAFGLGFYWAAKKSEPLAKVATVACYIVGVEVLWRMAQSSIYWESGKYGITAMMVIALVQRGHWRMPTGPLLYIGFLVPASIITIVTLSLSDARDRLSFNLSGPIALFVACWFFSHLKVTPQQLKRMLMIGTVPILSIALTTFFYTVSTENIRFHNESLFATSGGFGPNQVSSALGLGVFLCVSTLLIFKSGLKDNAYLAGLALFLAGSSVITFSRGGIFNAIGAIIIVIVIQLSDIKQGIRKLLVAGGFAVVFLALLFPYLNEFTGGALQTRFTDSGTTNRTELIAADFQVFMSNPILGVGVGEAPRARQEQLGLRGASHTEFTRIVSEHGVLGIFSLIALGLGTLGVIARKRTITGKAFACGVVVWSSLFMLNAGMRVAAPALLWSLSYVSFVRKKSRPKRVLRLRQKTANGGK